MTRHTMLLSAAFVASLAVTVAVRPAQTAPEMTAVATPSQTVQSAGVHALVGGSFHAVSIGF